MIKCKPKDMLPLEQVACMIWLANNCTLPELRERQDIINMQKKAANEYHLDEALDNLSMMWKMTTAAVCYQCFDENECHWLMYIEASEFMTYTNAM